MCDERSSVSIIVTVEQGHRTTLNNLYRVYQRTEYSSYHSNTVAFMSVLPSYNAVNNNAVGIFKRHSRDRSDENPPTHCVMTSKTYQISDDKDLEELYAELGRHLSCAGSEMICVSECRTCIFPMYYDLDMKLPIETLRNDAIQSVARVIVKQTLRFYPEADHTHLGTCIVTDKTGHAVQNPDTGLYKHGVHLHFPRIMVDADSARQIRIGVLNGLVAYLGSWVDILGVDPGDTWDDIVDDAVYNTGLRMIGAPKATKCKACTPKQDDSCTECRGQNNRHIIDRRVYKLCMVLTADGERDGGYEHELRNICNLLTKCSVRAPRGTAPTEGYAIYPGCPQLTSTHLTAASTGRKRKITIAALSGSARRPADRRYTDEITDARARDIARKYLVIYSDKYATCTFKLLRGGNTIRVKLYGDDAKYCINKAGYHRSNNVYMDIVRTGLDAYVYMKCYCPCKTTQGRSGYHVHCGQLYTRTKKGIDREEVNVLFANTSLSEDPVAQAENVMFGMASAASARKRLDDMTDEEFLRASGVDMF